MPSPLSSNTARICPPLPLSSPLENIRCYWNSRAVGYSGKTVQELDSQDKPWLERLAPYLQGRALHILDIGCGPGFFSLLLARLGHRVTAFDYAENMLDEAAANAAREGLVLSLQQGDAQHLPFVDASFDLVVSRNLTWNLEDPGQAYGEWLRVLKAGAWLVNFDGNHYRYLHDEYFAEEKRLNDASRHSPEHMQGVDPAIMEDIARSLPLSLEDRPAWDRDVLHQLGAADIRVQNEHTRILGRELVTAFMVAAQKA